MQLGDPTDLGGRIKGYRRSLGESQEEFGKRFNVKRLAVINWEKGVLPNSTHLPKIMAAIEAAESQPPALPAYQFELPFEEPLELAVRMSPQASKTIHFELRVRTKAS